METEFKPRIPRDTAGLMMGTALFFACLQWLFSWILMGWLVVIFSYLTFFVWFKMRDVGFLERFGAKKIIAWVICPFLGVATLGVIPGAVITVFMTIQIVWFEDKLVEKNYVSREDLRALEAFVIQVGGTHGFDSSEFRDALSKALGKKIEERYDEKKLEIKNRAIAKAKSSRFYGTGQALYDYSQQPYANKVEKDKAA